MARRDVDLMSGAGGDPYFVLKLRKEDLMDLLMMTAPDVRFRFLVRLVFSLTDDEAREVIAARPRQVPDELMDAVSKMHRWLEEGWGKKGDK